LLTAICCLLGMSAARCADTTPSKPILFYLRQDEKYSGGANTETDDHLAQAMLHDRLVPLLADLLHAQIVNADLGAPTSAQLTDACRSHGTVGVVSVENPWQVDPSAKSAAIVQVSLQNCSGTEWFMVDGGAHRDSARDANLESLMKEAIGQVSEKLKKTIHDTPNAASNFVHYGFYMNDAETDSLWTLAIAKGKTVVDSCDPVGTAYRAGLRVGDEVVSINENSTDGLDQAALNAVLENAKRAGPWTLQVKASNGTTRTVTFENEPVSWYVAHPAP
jgi:hypothetical protein